MRALILVSAACLALAACGDDTNDFDQNGTGTPPQNSQINWASNGTCTELNNVGLVQVVATSGDQVSVRPVGGSVTIETTRACLVEANAETDTIPRADDPMKPRTPSN